jgi:hypothetical protein
LYRQAFRLSRRYEIHPYEAAIVAAALELGAYTLDSEGLSDGQEYDGVKVVNPFLLFEGRSKKEEVRRDFYPLYPSDPRSGTATNWHQAGFSKTSWAVRGCTPLGFSLSARLGQRAANTICIEVFCVNRRTRLLAPGLIKATGINTIESKLINKLHYDGFSCAGIARYGQGDPPRCAFGPPQLHQVSGIDIVESLDHRPVQLLRNPSALRHTGLDRIDTAIALARVIVASIYDHYIIERCCEQIARQLWDILLGNCHDDHSSASSRFGNRHWLCAGFCGQVGERFRTS